jgi:hypothetical protein
MTTFEHQGRYNLLFEPAQYDQSQFLEQETRPLELQTVEQVFVALQGLASALAMLHYFHSSQCFHLSFI